MNRIKDMFILLPLGISAVPNQDLTVIEKTILYSIDSKAGNKESTKSSRFLGIQRYLKKVWVLRPFNHGLSLVKHKSD